VSSIDGAAENSIKRKHMKAQVMVFEKPQKKTVTKPIFLMKPSSDIHGMSQTFRPCEPPMKESCFFNTLPESRWGTKIATHTHFAKHQTRYAG
jgi:hypothetical protein